MNNERRIVLVIHGSVLLIFGIIFTFDVATTSSKLCLNSEENVGKTWGPRCQFLCRCQDNAECDSRTGFCANGCTPGWSRSPDGRCNIRLVRNVEDLPSPVLYHSLHETSSRLHHRRRSARTDYMDLYKLWTDDMCRTDANGSLLKLWFVTSDPPVQIKMFRITFDVIPSADDTTTCMFTLADLSGYSVEKELKMRPGDNENQFSMSPDSIIATSITITVKSPGNSSSACTQSKIVGYFMLALPICPYRKWGLHCTNDCPCPCDISQCHPTSGSCNILGFTCPSTKFGPNCNLDCSTRCRGEPQMCHPLTGTCLECHKPNFTGVNCESVVNFTDMASRPCNRFVAQMNVDEFGTNMTNTSQSAYIGINGTAYAAVLLVAMFFIIFLLFCCSYIQFVHFCAKKRLKERMNNLNEDRRRRASMVTYTELSREFLEMQDYRRKSFHSGSSHFNTTSYPDPALKAMRNVVNTDDVSHKT